MSTKSSSALAKKLKQQCKLLSLATEAVQSHDTALWFLNEYFPIVPLARVYDYIGEVDKAWLQAVALVSIENLQEDIRFMGVRKHDPSAAWHQPPAAAEAWSIIRKYRKFGLLRSKLHWCGFSGNDMSQCAYKQDHFAMVYTTIRKRGKPSLKFDATEEQLNLISWVNPALVQKFIDAEMDSMNATIKSIKAKITSIEKAISKGKPENPS